MNQEIHVVVLGAGYAGLMAAMRLAKKTDSSVDITLVNADDVFHERVRNHQLAAGQPVRRHGLDSIVRGTRIQFLPATVTALRPSERQVTVQTATGIRSLGYDYLVYALGSFVGTRGVPGASEHAYTLDHASTLALAECLPGMAARGERLLIVGGGNTGVEVSTELAESYPGLKITLATRHSFAYNLSTRARDHIRKAFQRLGIQFMEQTAITQLGADHALTGRGDTIPFEACLWVGGFAVSDLPRRAGLRVNGRDQILIDRAMRSLSHPEVYAVGDAAFPAEEPGAPVRMGLYTAIMMGAHGADCLAAHINGKAATAFGLSYAAFGVSLGPNDGVWQFVNGNTEQPLNLMYTGRAANWSREFFVRFALWAIRMQRVAPWTYTWLGKRKMRNIAVGEPHAAASIEVPAGSVLRSEE